MKLKIVLLGMFVLFGGMISAQTKKTTVTKKTSTKTEKRLDEFEMKQYFLVLLKKGPKRDQDSVTAAQIQDGHMKHLDKMYRDGKMDLAGPMGDEGDIRGICVYNVATMEEVKKFVEMDPAIQSGRLVAEIHPWWAAKKSVLR
jgi:uncharacterized protein